MASSPLGRKGPSRRTPLKDRRAAPDAAQSSLRKLKGALNRPIGLQRRDGKLCVVLAERRRSRPADEEPSIALLCVELSARLLAHEANEAAQTMRHLILVHDALERKSWLGLETLSSLVLARAIEQASVLAREEPSPHMDMLIEGLRPLQAAAALREQREAQAHEMRLGDNVEVSESDYAEFEDAEQDWSSSATMPLDLVPPRERDD
ncbi:MAG: hypothetical protein KIT60_00795 [Burkholderiaceae bacterium]|nr:hypothetical protein [Burkholderiaceae bacterium]